MLLLRWRIEEERGYAIGVMRNTFMDMTVEEKEEGLSSIELS